MIKTKYCYDRDDQKWKSIGLMKLKEEFGIMNEKTIIQT